MAIDLLSIQPTTISRDLRNKFILIYSQPKVGKTSFAAQAGALVLAFEKGYNAISGLSAVDINKWADLKVVLKQLERPEVQAKYETIAIDTVGIMWEMCEQFICAQNNVGSIADIPWGKGYSLCKKEFETCLRRITMLNYGLIIIAHSEIKKEKIGEDKNGDDITIDIIGPAIPKRAEAICNQLVDIIGYIGVEFDEDGNSKRTLYTRRTPTLMAGSRFPHLPARIPFGYRELTDALVRAIEMSGQRDGAIIIDKSEVAPVEERDFEEIQGEARELWSTLVEKDPKNASKILAIVEKVFGQKLKLSDIVESQKDLFELVIMEMRAL